MNMMTKIKQQLGGFQEAAERLSALEGRPWSRQGVQQMHKRRLVNGFPDRRTYMINGKPLQLFDLQEITDWYAFPEAAALLTRLTGKLHSPSAVWKLWKRRERTGFPDRVILPNLADPRLHRRAFDHDEIEGWLSGKHQLHHPPGS